MWHCHLIRRPYVTYWPTTSDDNLIPTPHTPHQQHVEMGQGCSRRQSQALLTYARTLGPKGEELPTQLYQLWNAVSKVSSTDMQVTFCDFITP